LREPEAAGKLGDVYRLRITVTQRVLA